MTSCSSLPASAWTLHNERQIWYRGNIITKIWGGYVWNVFIEKETEFRQYEILQPSYCSSPEKMLTNKVIAIKRMIRNISRMPSPPIFWYQLGPNWSLTTKLCWIRFPFRHNDFCSVYVQSGIVYHYKTKTMIRFGCLISACNFDIQFQFEQCLLLTKISKYVQSYTRFNINHEKTTMN